MGVRWWCWLHLAMLLLLQQTHDVTCVRHNRRHDDVNPMKSQLIELQELLYELEYDEYYSNEEIARQFMDRLNEELRELLHRTKLCEWNYSTNITDYTQNKLLEVQTKFDTWSRATLSEAQKFRYQNFRSADLRRQFRDYTDQIVMKDPNEASEKNQLESEMMSRFSTATVCFPRVAWQHGPHSNHCLSLDPDLSDLMAKSRDPEVLKWAWLSWREVAGKPAREDFRKMVTLLNKGARATGFSDYGEFWRQSLFPDHTDVIGMTSRLWEELRPLYLELHAYVRRKLREKYGEEVVGKDGAIPAHLLGNMWAQEWNNIYDIVQPYPDPKSSRGQTLDDVIKARYDVTDLFELADDFYSSLGLPRMTNIFWQKSMFVKPTDREVVCHATASDLTATDDFRIKMCTEVDLDNLMTVHHEMGHVTYFMAYSHLPALYRDGANCAFHEAIGDTIALSVVSRTHLQSLGLVEETDGEEEEERENINALMKMALKKIAFLPFGLLVDRWRWDVYSGQTTPENYNRDWWKLRLEIQGLTSLEPRSEADFDPAAKFHVAINSPYICYFACHAFQFQFLEAMCKVKGHKGPLHLCDLAGSKEAGSLLRGLMEAGSSRPWQDLLEEMTGSRDVSAQPIIGYFRPLYDWLKADNARHSEPLGWDDATVNWREE